MARVWLIVVLAAASAVAQEPLTPEQAAEMKKAYYAMQAENEALKRELGPLRKRAERVGRDHRDVINRQQMLLLESPDKAVVLAGLQLMAEANRLKHPARPYSPAIQRALVDFIDAPDPEIARLAVQVLTAYGPSAAARNGYQQGDGPWRPVGHDSTVQFRQHDNFYQSKVDVRGDFTATELAERLDLFPFKLVIHKDVRPQEPISCKRESDSLVDFIEQTLEPRGLTIRMTAEGGELLRLEDARAMVLRAYNIRGLLTAETTLDKAVEQARAAVDRRTEVLAVAPHTVLVRGRETQHHKASVALGKLRP